jgi:hypothetical protein
LPHPLLDDELSARGWEEGSVSRTSRLQPSLQRNTTSLSKEEMNECTMLRQVQAHASVGGKECMAGRKNDLSLLVFVVLYSGFEKELGSS